VPEAEVHWDVNETFYSHPTCEEKGEEKLRHARVNECLCELYYASGNIRGTGGVQTTETSSPESPLSRWEVVKLILFALAISVALLSVCALIAVGVAHFL
jgi:hypothetical protein